MNNYQKSATRKTSLMLTWELHESIRRRARTCYAYIKHPMGDIDAQALADVHDANIIEIEVALKNAIDEAAYLLSKP